MDNLTLCKSWPFLWADDLPFFPPLVCSSEGFTRGSHCCLFSKSLPSPDKLTWLNCKSNHALFWLKENALFRLEMLWKCLLVALGSLRLPPLPTPFLKSARPAVIIPSLAMNSELYMKLQAGQSPGHWTHLDYQDATIWTPGHPPCRKCCAGTSFTYRSVIMYLQGLADFGYNDTLRTLKDRYAKRMWNSCYC